MTIAKEELVKLAKKGFALLSSKEEAERLRGYYALCFCFGSDRVQKYKECIETSCLDCQVANLEAELLNSIND